MPLLGHSSVKACVPPWTRPGQVCPGRALWPADPLRERSLGHGARETAGPLSASAVRAGTRPACSCCVRAARQSLHGLWKHAEGRSDGSVRRVKRPSLRLSDSVRSVRLNGTAEPRPGKSNWRFGGRGGAPCKCPRLRAAWSRMPSTGSRTPRGAGRGSGSRVSLAVGDEIARPPVSE